MPQKKFSLDSKPVRIFLIALCVVLTFILYFQRRTKNYYKEAAKLPFYNVQPAEVADGTYRGKTYTSFLHVQLDVTVQDGTITTIQIILLFRHLKAMSLLPLFLLPVLMMPCTRVFLSNE